MDSDKSKTTIINLKILGELEMGVKLNTRERYFTLDDTTWYQGLNRKWRGDTRDSTYEKVSQLVTETKELLESNEPNLENTIEEFVNFMVPIIDKAKKGLRSLQETYTADKTFISQIDLEISVLERIIQKLDPSNKYINNEDFYDQGR
jgi:hypothetical protein